MHVNMLSVNNKAILLKSQCIKGHLAKHKAVRKISLIIVDSEI